MSSFSERFLTSMETVASKVVGSTSIDKTITATIVSLEDVTIAAYKVYYEGATFTAYGTDLTKTYSTGESVYVLVPEGNFSATKLIISNADYGSNTTYADQQSLLNQWRTRGSNWLSGAMYWRTEDGDMNTADVAGGIVVCTPGKESDIGDAADLSEDGKWMTADPCWRNYIYNRDGFPYSYEETLTEDRIDRSYNMVTSAPGEVLADALTSVDSELQIYGSQMDYIMVSANFQTAFLSSHTTGDYGILVECYVDNPNWSEGSETETQYKLQSYKLSFSDFNGAPYAFAVATPQQAVFSVSRGTIKGLARVSLFQDDSWVTDLGPTVGYYDDNGDWVLYDSGEIKYDADMLSNNNVFATDIAIYWCEPIELSSNFFWLDMKTIHGTSVYDGNGEYSSYSKVTLQPRLMYGADDVTSEDTCKFIWFRRKYSVTTDLADSDEVDEYGNTWAGYLPEGEQGWCPIEEMIKSSEESVLGQNAAYQLGLMVDNKFTTTTATYKDTLQVPIEEVPWQWDYLCVCYYNSSGGSIDDIYRSDQNDALIWMEQTVTNLSSPHDFELPDIYIPDGGSTMYLRVRNNSAPWHEEDYYNPDDPSEPHPGRDWICRWWVEGSSGYRAMQDANYDRFIKGRRNVTDYINNEVLTFKAQIYGINNPAPDWEEGDTDSSYVQKVAQLFTDGEGVWQNGEDIDYDIEGDLFEIANVETVIAPADSADILVSFSGTTTHNYSSSGSLNDPTLGTSYQVTPSFTVTSNTIKSFSVEWLAPDGTPLGENAGGSVDEDIGYTMDGMKSMCKNMYTTYASGDDTRCTLNYSIEEVYDVDKAVAANNTFTLKFTYLDGTFDYFYCTITFTKSGYQGTQGSEWAVNIWPCNSDQTGTINAVAWTSPIVNRPVPLAVKGPYKGVDGGVIMEEAGGSDFSLYLRPFIRRNNTYIEDLTECTKYSYKVFWDCRLSAVNNSTSDRALASYGNFLKFEHVCGRDADDYGADGDYSNGTATLVGDSSYSAGTTQPADVVDSQAFTCSEDYQVGADETQISTYGALRVRWNGRSSIEGTGEKDDGSDEITFEDIGYSFVVKARVEIYYDGTGVASITSFFPVDIIFTGDTTRDISISDINPENISLTWPTEVLYTSSGVSPETTSSPLTFTYSEKTDGSALENVYTAKVENLTPEIQDLDDNSTGYNVLGAWNATTTYIWTTEQKDAVYHNQNYFRVKNLGDSVVGVEPDIDDVYNEDHPWSKISDLTEWTLSPRQYYFFENYDNGALATDITSHTGKWPEGYYVNPDFVSWGDSANLPTSSAEAAEWTHCTFVRTIVYYINQYGNESINGWDGKSIDINEEDGTIFSPTIGAGWKHPFTNTFSGVLMGIDTSQLKENYSLDYGGFSQDDINMNPYMTGLFGYQDGYCSFGIMENGTAFFGRADTGGRITIDGYNAQIYGGTTMEGETGLEADMRNKMRLSFIDFGGSDREMTYNEWADEEAYYIAAQEYQNWLEVYEVYYYYVTGRYLPSIKQPDEGDTSTYRVELNTSDDDTVTQNVTIKIKTGTPAADWDRYDVSTQYQIDWAEYKLDIQYRLAVDTLVSYFIKDMNKMDVGCTIGPIVNGKPGIAMQGFAVDGYTDPETGRIIDLDSVSTKDLESLIYSDFAYFFAPGVGVLLEDGTQDAAGGFMGIDYVAAQYAGYFTGNSYSTPAIEIGSYKDWMVDSETGERIIETRSNWLTAKYGEDYSPDKTYYHTGSDLIRSYTTAQIQEASTDAASLEIPGYRKFLVTYDGTLYAMNAFIKGNIIGSNIIASQFFNNDGSYVVFENGDLGIGPTDGTSSTTAWSETRVIAGYSTKWSAEVPEWEVVPTEDYFTDSDSLDNYLNWDSSEESNPFAFFVSNDGEVICKQIHISGGSINIGHFHVIGTDDADGGSEGDVVSFGTMYLVGTPDGMPEIGTTAVEGWGDFNLRGRLVNLGPVFLGGKTEKLQPGDIYAPPLGSEKPSSFNSPIAIVADEEGDREVNDDPNLPVQIGVWPLYFRSGAETEGEAEENCNWVAFSSGDSDEIDNNGFMPAFSGRANRTFVEAEGAGEENLASKVFWRVDQLGMWSDAAIFSKRDWVDNPIDIDPLNFEEHGLLYLGWWEKEGASSFALENYSYDAQDVIMETSSSFRLSSRGDEINTRGTTTITEKSPVQSTIILETAETYKYYEAEGQNSTATIVAYSGESRDDDTGSPNDIIGAIAGTVYLGGRRRPMNADEYSQWYTDSVNCTPTIDDTPFTDTNYVMDAFISINAIGPTGGRAVFDELGRSTLGVPAYTPGQIWVKGKGVAIDGAVIGASSTDWTAMDPSGYYLSTLRLNRNPAGGNDESNSSGYGNVLALGMSACSSAYLAARDIELRSVHPAELGGNIPSTYGGSGNIHIHTGEIDDNYDQENPFGWNHWSSMTEIFLSMNASSGPMCDSDYYPDVSRIHINGRACASVSADCGNVHMRPKCSDNALIIHGEDDEVTLQVHGYSDGKFAPRNDSSDYLQRFLTLSGADDGFIRLANNASASDPGTEADNMFGNISSNLYMDSTETYLSFKAGASDTSAYPQYLRMTADEVILIQDGYGGDVTGSIATRNRYLSMSETRTYLSYDQTRFINMNDSFVRMQFSESEYLQMDTNCAHLQFNASCYICLNSSEARMQFSDADYFYLANAEMMMEVEGDDHYIAMYSNGTTEINTADTTIVVMKQAIGLYTMEGDMASLWLQLTTIRASIGSADLVLNGSGEIELVNDNSRFYLTNTYASLTTEDTSLYMSVSNIWLKFSDTNQGIIMTPDSFTLSGYEPEQQFGIYARFA